MTSSSARMSEKRKKKPGPISIDSPVETVDSRDGALPHADTSEWVHSVCTAVR